MDFSENLTELDNLAELENLAEVLKTVLTAPDQLSDILPLVGIFFMPFKARRK